MKIFIAQHSFLLGACLLFGVAEGAGAAPRDIEEVRRLMLNGQVAAAKEKLIACADRKSPACQFLLAEWVERGELFQRDIEAARKLYELAYSGGYEPAGAAILRLAKEGRAETSAATSHSAKSVAEPAPGLAASSISAEAPPDPTASTAEMPFPLAIAQDPSPNVAGIAESRDESKGERTLFTMPSEGELGFDNVVAAFGAMRTKNKFQARIFLLYSSAPNKSGVQKLRFEKCKRATWRINGQPMRLGYFEYDFRRNSSGVMVERMTQHLTIEQMEMIGSAQRVTYTLCDYEGSISNAEISRIKLIVASIRMPQR